jgi:hypothetical protein
MRKFNPESFSLAQPKTQCGGVNGIIIKEMVFWIGQDNILANVSTKFDLIDLATEDSVAQRHRL